MLTLVFEVLPRPGQEGTYFDMAARLKPALDASGGLVFLDRSRRHDRPGWFLSHQYWQDEASMARWRTNAAHHRAQACGRTDILADYRLRVGHVVADLVPGGEIVRTPLDVAMGYDRSERAPRVLLTTANQGPLPGLPADAARFTSVYDPTLEIAVADLATVADGEAVLSALARVPTVGVARLSVLSRDYGMHQRAEAPQYFEPVPFEPVATLA
jgi:heme-degrading monooxygenase HmoA